MPKPLAPLERRVVGVLLEKVLSTPAYYPLTLNALTAGCNQKNNRDPEMTVSEADVQRTLVALQPLGLATSVAREGARVEKWKTGAREVYGLTTEKHMAVFAELLLRGPATRAELRSRASRMRHEITAEDLDGILADFAGRGEPLVVNLGRAPGGRAERYTHTLYDEGEMAALKSALPAAPPPSPSREPAEPPPPGLAERLDEALQEIADLRERVASLERAVEQMRGG
jgi:uncharacterized protein YceH (UPF0502 family)